MPGVFAEPDYDVVDRVHLPSGTVNLNCVLVCAHGSLAQPECVLGPKKKIGPDAI